MNVYIRDRFITSIKPPMDTGHLGIPTSMPSNNVVCLLTFMSYRHDVKWGDWRFGSS